MSERLLIKKKESSSMARPQSIQTGTILDAARKVFMRDGYQAGTARIAREAGVSEGSLFKHFKSKANLFLAAMEVEAGGTAWEERLMAGVGKGDPRKTLESAGLQLLEQLRLWYNGYRLAGAGQRPVQYILNLEATPLMP